MLSPILSVFCTAMPAVLLSLTSVVEAAEPMAVAVGGGAGDTSGSGEKVASDPSDPSDGGEGRSAAVPTLEAELELDGFLRESVWGQAVTLENFIEVEPVEGIAADPKSEVMMWRSQTHLYIGLRFWEPDTANMVLQNKHRDAFLNEDDRVQIVFDTFRDGKNAYFFQISAAGSRGDALIGGNGQNFNKRWDGFWEAEVQVQEDRWTAEIAIPFRTLACGDTGVWGANFERFRSHTRQTTRWTGAKREYGMMTVKDIGELTGFQGVDQGNGVTVTPYFKVKRLDQHGGASDWDTGFGGEVDWWITPQLKMSLTAATDFAETEVDNRRVNLSQYSLFYPEKRDFFLEDANLFEFGTRGNTVVPFYSRRIGLVSGEEVDVEAGMRLSGRAGPWDLGVLAVRTGRTRLDDNSIVPESELFVLRPSFNLNEEMTLGGILTYGNPEADDRNLVTGADWRYSTDAFGGQLSVNTYIVRSDDQSTADVDGMFGGRATLRTSEWNWTNEIHLAKGEFNPALGFVARPGQSNFESRFEWEPRPSNPGSSIRKYEFRFNPRVWVDNGGNVMSHTLTISPFGFELHDGSEFRIFTSANGDRVTSNDFDPGGVLVPAGYHSWESVTTRYESSEAKDFSWEGYVGFGGWYDGGSRTRFGVDLNYRPVPEYSLMAEYDENQADLTNGDFVTRVIALGGNLYPTPAVSWQNLVQMDNQSKELGWQSRLRWIHRDGQELFLVANLGWLEELDGSIVPTERDMAMKLVYSVRL